MRRATIAAATLLAVLIVGTAAAATRTITMWCPRGLNGYTLWEVGPGPLNGSAVFYNPNRVPQNYTVKLEPKTCVPTGGWPTCSYVAHTKLVPANTSVVSINVIANGLTYITKWCAP